MAEKEERPNFEDFDARMRRLRSDAGLDEPESQHSRKPVGGVGLHIGVELISGVIGGAALGYGLDYWFGTWPALFIVFFFLGAAAGILNAYRYFRRVIDVPDQRSERR